MAQNNKKGVTSVREKICYSSILNVYMNAVKVRIIQDV